MQGILFNVETGMLKSVLNGTKTMTRRLGGLDEVNVKPDEWTFLGWGDTMNIDPNIAVFWKHKTQDYAECKPRYKVGEIVYVKESHCWLDMDDGHGEKMELHYKVDNPEFIDGFICDDDFDSPAKWSNPMFCGEKESRHKIKILSVGVQRSTEITVIPSGRSEDDCRKEGAKNKADFIRIWNSINGKKDFEKNKWVFVYEFIKL